MTPLAAILSEKDLKGFQARFLWGMGKDDYDCLCVIISSHAALAARLATAQAMIERLTKALEEIKVLKLGVRETCDCRICQAQKIADAALAPETADGG